jgi:hypothetical protein
MSRRTKMVRQESHVGGRASSNGKTQNYTKTNAGA